MGNRKHDCAIADESGSPWRLIPLEKVRKKKHKTVVLCFLLRLVVLVDRVGVAPLARRYNNGKEEEIGKKRKSELNTFVRSGVVVKKRGGREKKKKENKKVQTNISHTTLKAYRCHPVTTTRKKKVSKMTHRGVNKQARQP